IAKNRAWNTAVQIRSTNIHQVKRACMDALRSMPEWSWEEYKYALTRKGYSVHERKDAQDVIWGYALVNGNTKYKASE
ncbi:relaxase, partial [Phocaeicola vulgatus]|nr:relaxase [Phocaeicola vulgatus]